jgi:NitT/TauT family transport system substrate-binding protein
MDVTQELKTPFPTTNRSSSGPRRSSQVTLRAARSWRLVSALAAVLPLVVLAGCSGSSDAQGGQHIIGSLTVAINGTGVETALPYIAQELGYFEQEGINVTILNDTGAETADLVASGKATLAESGIATALELAQQGKPTSVIYVHATSGTGSMLVSNPSITSIEQLKGKRIGTSALGTELYGNTVRYNQELGLHAQLVTFQSAADVLNAVVSGEVAGAVGSFDTMGQAIQQKKVNVLIDTRNPAVMQKYLGTRYVSVGAFGVTANLEANKEVIIRFLATQIEAEEWFNSHSNKDIADLLARNGAFSTTPVGTLMSEVPVDRKFVSGNFGGAITPAAWSYSLSRMASWGLTNFVPSDPTFSYDQRIDMQYLDAAKKLVAS